MASNAHTSYNFFNELDEPLIATLAMYMQHSEYCSFQKHSVVQIREWRSHCETRSLSEMRGDRVIFVGIRD